MIIIGKPLKANYLPWYVIKVIFFIVLLSSCVTQKNVEYMQDKRKSNLVYSEAPIEDYRLKPGDDLFIQITSLDDASASIFSGSGSQVLYGGSIQPYGASLISYQIDKEGYLHLPVIGSLIVKDKTITQVSEMLKKSLENVLNQPMISIKLVNRYVSVLGEVRTPGHFSYAQGKLTIYDALGFAGDITDYGNREEIVLTRNENGKNICINVDLTQSDILASEYYYVRPNDLIYVKPLKKKLWGMRQFPFAIILSTITTSLLIYSYIE